jgi:hypothetical protein
MMVIPAKQATVTDPMGYKTKSFYDDLGRRIWVAENYDNFDPAHCRRSLTARTTRKTGWRRPNMTVWAMRRS